MQSSSTIKRKSSTSGKENARKRHFCPHCGLSLSYSAFFAHKSRFYDSKKEIWIQQQSLRDCHENDSTEKELEAGSSVLHAEDYIPDATLDNTNGLEQTPSSVPMTEVPDNYDHDISSDEDAQADAEDSDIEIMNDEDSDADYSDQDLQGDAAANSDAATGSTEVSKLVRFICLFLIKFQLFFRVSNAAILTLLKFIHIVLSSIAKLSTSHLLNEILLHFPKTVYYLRKLAGMHKKFYNRYVVCPTCHSIYDPKLQKMTERDHCNFEVSIKCSYVRYPDHPQRSRRRPCGTKLMRKVKCVGNRYTFRPKLTYCYLSIKSSLAKLTSKPNFWSNCQQWRERSVPEGKLADVYDGKVWKEYIANGYFKGHCNLGLMLNVDWFQPFEHSTHSIGVIYLVILNLPRELRFKIENVLLVGIVPGPKEPKGTINGFLGPMVKELLELWHGCFLGNFPCQRFVRAALLCVSCDVPALRKVAGFVGHAGLRGCSKCLKVFPTHVFGEKPDYSGFDCEGWESRTSSEHRLRGFEHSCASSASERKRIEQAYGATYSVLFELPYYDCIRFPVIDPMHALFLGVAKHMFKVWCSHELLSELDTARLQERVDQLITPSHIGRIPLKLASGFSQMKADEWKNWTHVFSIYALKGILPERHLHCWNLFVQASLLFSKKVITISECTQAHHIFVSFCKDFLSLYGKSDLVINMHLLCHLRECIVDYGPASSFWCFGFERFNGLLGSLPSNRRDVPVTIMNRFLDELLLDVTVRECSYQSAFLDLYSSNVSGSLHETFSDNYCFFSCNPSDITKPVSSPNIIASGMQAIDSFRLRAPLREYIIPNDKISYLRGMYKAMYGDSLGTVTQVCIRAAQISFYNISLSSSLARTERGSCILAHWVSSVDFSKVDTEAEARAGIVRYYVEHNLEIHKTSGVQYVRHFLAFVSWFQPHSRKNSLGEPLELWKSEFLPVAVNSFIPLGRIKTILAFAQGSDHYTDMTGVSNVVTVPVL